MDSYMIFSIIFVTLLMAFQANFYFDSVLGKSRRKPRRAIYFIVFILLDYFYLVSSFSDIVSTAVALLLIFSLAQSYEVEFKIKLVFTILYAVLITMANTIAVYILGVLESTEFISWEQFNGENHWILSKVMLVGCSIMFIVIQIVRLVAKRRSFAVHYRYYLLFLIVPIITIYQINVASIYSEKNIFYVFSVLGSLFLNVFIVYVFDNMVEKVQLAHENTQLQRQMDYQDANYEKTVHSFKNIKSIIHDINQQFLYIDECIQRNELAAAGDHIKSTLNTIEGAYQRVNSGNLVIDALVTNTLAMGQANGIKIDTKIQLHSQHIQIDRYDLCVVLGNMLDNAIEASKKVRQAEDRYILIAIHSTSSALVIQIMNHVEQPIVDLKSEKPNPEYHGIGLTNISRMCEKYGGHMSIEHQHRKFNNMVVLPFHTDNP
ncbi:MULTISPECIES: GHKL domain-containing protein [Paenibacillus]|uniref:GHKL domain-containing protein n=1 Tax=Paenibacillus TaxID=44249 RepID=UPI0008891179|nr:MULTISPECIES: GHKL domain-containing protein [Paenibacillus]MCL6658789.1 GHKL domain-containing protein [Paenibacillus amylolyticus]TDL68874.1 GHKL domain-containing protein [Paenibacillus amylolyticus]UOK60840.1 GHKL domain-containing protein [Paenibacillus sp. OVF10]SDC65238.1 GHKL domain-containing protein [Paenibacillus sp. CF095]